MTSKRMVVLIVGVLILSVLLPVMLSVWLAHFQAEKDFNHDLKSYGERVVLRSQQVVRQAGAALDELNRSQAIPCSEQHLQEMRRVAYTRRDIQEVLWLNALKPQCSSLESTIKDMQFPETSRQTHTGYRVWLTHDNDLGIRHYMVALANQHYVVMIDPASFVDVMPFASWPINAALIAHRSGNIIASSAPFDLQLWRQAQREGVQSLTHQGVLYNVQEYPELGVSLAVWAPLTPLNTKWHQQMMLWLPAGILVGLLASIFTLRMVRNLQSPYHRMLEAINQRRIVVYYQPIVSLTTGKVVGAEALARWPQLDGSELSPEIFIPQAEESGLITRLTALIIENVFHDLAPWLKAHPQQHISINIDPRDLTSSLFPALLQSQLQQWQIHPSQIALELTERSFTDPKKSAAVLSRYRKAGHPVYLDDFGTGYSSLSYLQDLDVDTLKIDKSFVDALEFKSVTPHIIEMAKALGLVMVAEGVESERQQQWLQRHGVQYAQGWLYSKALSKQDFIAWADENLRDDETDA